MKIPTFLFVCLALLHASVLEATEWNQETALAELLTLSQSKERRAQARDWLERLEKAEVDLGKQGFVEAVARLFAGDAPGARETLVVYLRRYRTLPSSEYEPQLASLTLATTNRAVVTGAFDTARLVLPFALKRIKDRKIVFQRIVGSLTNMKSIVNSKPAARAFLEEIKSMIVSDPELSGAEKAAILKKVSKPPRRRTIRPAVYPFKAKDLDGKDVALEDYKGKVLLIDFWATWCGPCIRELPGLVAMHKEHHKQGFEILSVSIDKPGAEKTIRDKMKQLGITWKQIYADGKRLGKNYRVRTIPAIYLFDRHGRMRYAKLRGAVLKAKVKELLAEAPPKAD